MLPFHKIPFPVDYSAPCQAVIPYVQEMACRYSAELTVCHAYAPLGAIAQSELLVTDPELQTRAHELEEDRLRQFACQAFAGQKLETIVELGEPGSVIDRLAEQQRADLVMLATRGHGPVRRFLLGSITAKVLHDVSAAVWTGVGAALMDHPARIPYKSIVCALNGGQESEAVLRAAASLASTYGAELWIVHVVPTPPAYPDMDLVEHTELVRFHSVGANCIGSRRRRSVGHLGEQRGLGNERGLGNQCRLGNQRSLAYRHARRAVARFRGV